VGRHIGLQFEGLFEEEQGLLVVLLGEVDLRHADERIDEALVVVKGCFVVVDGGVHFALVETVGALEREGHSLEVVLVGVVEVLDDVLEVLGGLLEVLLLGGLDQVVY
jgi:hypothetical protein